jgi:hypothetical protein
MTVLLLAVPWLPTTPATTTPATTAYAQADERCFQETGYCISGAIRAYWERNGGLAVFGLPISPLRTETVEGTWTGPVQWFERDRLEDHGANGVLAGRLGAHRLNAAGDGWWRGEQRVSAEAVPFDCNYSVQTGHSLCEPFLSYWLDNGGLERFGYPITEPLTTTIDGWSGTVQYFERRRLELHEGGTVLLGRLGSEVLERSGEPAICSAGVVEDLRESFEQTPFRDVLGCPQQAYQQVEAQVQPFDGGQMIGVDLDDAGLVVYALYTLSTDGAAVPAQRIYQGNQTADTPVPAAPAPPAGRPAPWQGFARVLQDDPELQQALGWPTAAAGAQPVTLQRFSDGALLWLHTSDTVYALGPARQQAHTFARPLPATAAPAEVELLEGIPAPALGGDLVVRTRSIDFYRLPGGMESEAILWISQQAEEAIAVTTRRMGTHGLNGRIAIRFEPALTGPCAYRGLTLSSERTILLYYEPGTNPMRVVALLAHEFVHQLQQDYYGAPHLVSDTILLEGMATWASSDYYQTDDGRPEYHVAAKEALNSGTLLPLTTDLNQDCRTSTRNHIYEQWASFFAYLLETYGREKIDAVYVDSRGRAPGSANFQGVYGKSLAELEAAWIAWLAEQP